MVVFVMSLGVDVGQNGDELERVEDGPQVVVLRGVEQNLVEDGEGGVFSFHGILGNYVGLALGGETLALLTSGSPGSFGASALARPGDSHRDVLFLPSATGRRRLAVAASPFFL